MKRRTFSSLAIGGLFASGTIGRAQTTAARTWRIGFLSGTARPPDGNVPALLRQALDESGFAEGSRVVYEGRWINAQPERLAAYLSELLALRVDVLVTMGAPAAAAARQTTSSTPIVVIYAGDVVETGLVASLARPGGNLTGINDQSSVLSAKRLEILKEAVPAARRIAVLWNTGDAAMMLRFRQIERAAESLGLAIEPYGVREPDDFVGALAGMDRSRPDALIMVADALTNLNRQRVVAYAAEHRIPAIYEASFVVRGGGLMSYGDDVGENYRLAAGYVARILRGEKPSALPIQQPNRYYLVINLRTAESLGVTISPALRLRADELIE